MLMNLSEVLNSEGKEVTEQVPYEAEVFHAGQVSYPIADKTLVDLHFRNMGVGKAEISGKMDITLVMQCDRCLSEIREVLKLDFVRDITAPGLETEPDDEDDQSFMDGYEFDVDSLINNEILISMPDKVLCKQDCKGLCKKCGQNLNLGDCGCDDFVPDPRMAAIKDIFEANKEV